MYVCFPIVVVLGHVHRVKGIGSIHSSLVLSFFLLWFLSLCPYLFIHVFISFVRSLFLQICLYLCHLSLFSAFVIYLFMYFVRSVFLCFFMSFCVLVRSLFRQFFPSSVSHLVRDVFGYFVFCHSLCRSSGLSFFRYFPPLYFALSVILCFVRSLCRYFFPPLCLSFVRYLVISFFRYFFRSLFLPVVRSWFSYLFIYVCYFVSSSVRSAFRYF